MKQKPGIFEEYTDTKYLKILTEERLEIPGLCLFGRQIRTTATECLPPHEHGNCYEIVFICSGNPIFQVGTKTYVLSGGDVFLTLPHEIHSTASMPVSVSEMYWLQLDLSSFSNALFLDESAVALLRSRLNHFHLRTVSMDLNKTSDFLKHAFLAAKAGGNPMLVAQYISLFLFLLLEASDKVGFKLTPDIGRATTYILDHLDEKLSLDELASIAFLSTSQFKQKFKQQLGVSPRQFINTQKIIEAKELLLEGQTTSQVAAALQFESSSYFITVFKRYTSCTPSEYKQRHRQISAP